MKTKEEVTGINKAGFIILTQEVLDEFYASNVSSRPDINVFKLGLIAAYDHFSSVIGTTKEKRINTEADRVKCAQAAELDKMKAITEWEEQKWQPIGTAPKDGTDILLHCKYSKVPLVGFINKNGIHANKDFLNTDGDANVIDWIDEEFITHWQPLPQPPESEAV